jgi:aryl-alcohol dehydrogenase-like predicted oxidoreductase
MEYRKLGRTGLRVSPICLGTMNFGWTTEEPESFAIMNRALDEGVNFFDTANVYGETRTEQIIGRWFAEDSTRRDRTVLATKVFGGRDSWPNTGRLSARHIRDACEASLRRLQTDHIDLYQMHHIDRDTPWDEIWQAMEILVAQGKVIYVGSSNFAGWHIAQANEAAKSRHFLGLVSEQSLYNLTERTIELEVIPAAEHYGLAILPWSPLAGGALGGAIGTPGGERRQSERTAPRVEELRPQLEAYEKLCAEVGEKPADVAIAWLLANPAVTAPIYGPRTMEQFTGSLRTLDITLDADTLQKLDEIFPGPGGTAPEAYAW